MQFHAEPMDGFVQRVSIDLDASEVDRYFEKVYADFAFQYHIAGCEPYQAQPSDIDAAFGNQAVVDAVVEAVKTYALPQAMDACDLVAIGSPAFAAERAPEPGQPFSLQAMVPCSPIPELSSWDEVHIRIPQLPEDDPQAAQMRARIQETEAMAALAQRVVGPLPEVLCDAEEETIIQAVYEQANRANVPFTDYLAQQGLDMEAFNQSVLQRAQESVRSDLALDAWAHHIGAQVSDERVTEEFVRQGFASPALEEAQWRANGRLPQLRQAIRRRMALDDIAEHLVVETID